MSIRTLFAGALLAALQLLLTAVAASAASLSLSDSVGPPATSITVKGTGFAKNAIVDVYFDLTQKAFRLTSSSGTFSMTLRVPTSAEPGEHLITVMPHTGTGPAAQRAFTVQSNWTQRRFGPSGQAWNRYENLLNTSSVRSMSLTWDLDGATAPALFTTPLVVGSRVYLLTGDKRLKAYSRVTRAKLFDIAANGERITQPAYGNGLVFVPQEGGLAAHNGTTGALVWKAVLPPGVGGPVVRDGVVYVVARGNADAGLFAFSVTCGRGGATCSPLWQSRVGPTSGYIYPETSLAVTPRGVFAIIGRTLYQFTLGCGAAECSPKSSLPDVDSHAPTLSNGIVYVTKSDSTLVVLREFCIICAPIWTGTLSERTNRDVTVANGTVYVASSSRLYAFAPGCGGATCTPLWTTNLRSGGYSVSVAAGVVYVPTVNHLVAYPVSCYTGCPPLWQSGAGGVYSNVNYMGAAIVDGAVYVGSDDGLKVYSDAASPVATRGVRVAAAAAAVRLDRLKPSPRLAAAEAELARLIANRR